MPAPWQHWYHVTGNTYGTWLRGSDLGFRERHHRIHVEGDYKNPPPPGRYARLKKRSRQLMTRPPVYLSAQACARAVALFAESFRKDQIRLRCAALNAHHYHILLQCPDSLPKKWTARAKGRAAHALIKLGLVGPGKVFALRCGVRSICSSRHWRDADEYILRHQRQGAFVWHEELGLLAPVGHIATETRPNIRDQSIRAG